jgi:hypothetical protein
MKHTIIPGKTCITMLAAAGIAFAGLTHATGGSSKEERKKTLSPQTTHGNESTLGNSKPGTSGSGASQGSANTSQPKGSSTSGSPSDKFTNSDTGGGGSGSSAPLQGGVMTNKQGTAGGANSAGGTGGMGKDSK